MQATSPEKMTKTIHKERITFGNHQNVFFNDVKKQVKAYFEEREIKSTGNTALYLKALLFSLIYVGAYLLLLLISVPPAGAILLCAIMGISAAGLGFNVMHDGGHGSFSTKKWMNNLCARYIYILGGDAMLWRNKHNIIHHTFTNIEGFDQDIAQMPVLRLNSLQKKHWFHKYQHLYCLPVYGISSMLWTFLLDFQKYFTRKVGNIRIPKITAKEHLLFWASKIGYVLIYLIIPASVWGWPATILGFVTYHFVLGITISTVFQLAHVVEDTDFPDSHFDSHKIEDEWAIHQLKTTANFATGNKFITWFVGGLNFQIEHHLFPKISHVHYPALSKIIRKAALKHGITYNEYPTFMAALKSHLHHMKITANS